MILGFRAIAIATLILMVGGTAAYAQDAKPNFLFIFADDFAYDCVGSAGNDEVTTPRLDELAKQSTRFTHCYNMGSWSGAVCVASRSMLNTGHFVWRAQKAVGKMKDEYVPGRKMWSQRMEDAGYDTYMTGKWHVKAQPESIFKTVRHVRPGMPNQVPKGYNRPKSPEDREWLPWDPEHEGFWKGGKHWSEIVADDAEDFIGMAKDSEKPFFMYIAFNAPHDPRQSPQKFVEMYPVEKVSLPKPFYPTYPHELGMIKIRDEKLAPFPRNEFNIKTNRAEYYAIISHLDVQIGRILDALKKSGKANSTYIVFTADHGLACGHHGLMGKQNMHDHSLRVPFFIAGPDVPSGKSTSEKIYLQDAMATSLDLAGAGRPEGVEFHSVMPIVKDNAASPYKHIYGGYLKSQRAIIAGNHKLVIFPKLGTKLLYDHSKDEWEENDIAADNPELVQKLTTQLQALQKEMDDEVSLTPALKAAG